MSRFKRGDSVAFHFDKSTVGTVTRANKSEIRVLWADGIETPVDPLELIHAEKDRSISDQESAAAPESITQKDYESMTKPIFQPGDRVSVQPDRGIPSTATVVIGPTFGHADNVAVHLDGPSISIQPVHVSRLSMLATQSALRAEAVIQDLTRAELDDMAEAIKQATEAMDLAHAVQLMEANPVPLRNNAVHTVTDIADWCDKHGVKPSAGYAAFQQVHGIDCNHACGGSNG